MSMEKQEAVFQSLQGYTAQFGVSIGQKSDRFGNRHRLENQRGGKR